MVTRTTIDSAVQFHRAVHPLLRQAYSFGDQSFHAIAVHGLSVLAVVFVWMATGGQAVATLLFGGLVSSIVYPYIAWVEWRRSSVGLSPLSFFFIWHAVGVGLSAMFIGQMFREEDYLDFSVVSINAADVATGYLVLLAGQLCFHAGAQAFRPAPAKSPVPIERSTSLAAVIVFFMVGFLSAVFSSQLTSLGTISQVPMSFSFGSMVFLALNNPDRLRIDKATHSRLLFAGTIALFIQNLASGSKAMLMFSFLPVLWHYIMNPFKRRALILLGPALAMFYLGVVAPGVKLARQNADTAQSMASKVWASLLEQKSEESRSSASLEVESQEFLMRQFEATPVGFFIEHVRIGGFLGGASLVEGLYGLVPRILWPDKPNVTRGAWFTAYLGAAADEQSATTSTGMTAIGELYWNFGVIGVMGGMAFTGALMGALLWRLCGDDPAVGLVSASLYTNLMLNSGNMPEADTVWIGYLSAFVLYSVTMKILPSNGRSKVQLL